MPYIIQEKRETLEPAVVSLVNALRELESDDPNNNMEGNVNYVITTLLKRVYSVGNYRDINDAIGVLACAQHELYRTYAVPYEEQKRFENGDV